jgi:hypothetical protein
LQIVGVLNRKQLKQIANVATPAIINYFNTGRWFDEMAYLIGLLSHATSYDVRTIYQISMERLEKSTLQETRLSKSLLVPLLSFLAKQLNEGSKFIAQLLAIYEHFDFEEKIAAISTCFCKLFLESEHKSQIVDQVLNDLLCNSNSEQISQDYIKYTLKLLRKFVQDASAPDVILPHLEKILRFADCLVKGKLREYFIHHQHLFCELLVLVHFSVWFIDDCFSLTSFQNDCL